MNIYLQFTLNETPFPIARGSLKLELAELLLHSYEELATAQQSLLSIVGPTGKHRSFNNKQGTLRVCKCLANNKILSLIPKRSQ